MAKKSTKWRFTVRLPKDLENHVNGARKLDSRTVNSWVAKAVTEKLARDKGQAAR